MTTKQKSLKHLSIFIQSLPSNTGNRILVELSGAIASVWITMQKCGKMQRFYIHPGTWKKRSLTHLRTRAHTQAKCRAGCLLSSLPFHSMKKGVDVQFSLNFTPKLGRYINIYLQKWKPKHNVTHKHTDGSLLLYEQLWITQGHLSPSMQNATEQTKKQHQNTQRKSFHPNLQVMWFTSTFYKKENNSAEHVRPWSDTRADSFHATASLGLWNVCGFFCVKHSINELFCKALSFEERVHTFGFRSFTVSSHEKSS